MTTSRQETLTNWGKEQRAKITQVTSRRPSPQASRKAKCRVRSEAPQEKRMQTKKERRYRIPHSAEAARQGDFHGRSQQRKTYANPKERLYTAKFIIMGRSHMQERDKSHQHTRREVTCDSDNTRDSKTSQQCRTNQGTTQWRMCVNT